MTKTANDNSRMNRCQQLDKLASVMDSPTMPERLRDELLTMYRELLDERRAA